jgi:hypothetical protein
MSLSLYPKELAAAREAIVWPVSGVGFGCTLIHRDVVARFPFRAEAGNAPDIPFATDCLRAGVLAVGRFDVEVGHVDEEQGDRVLQPFDEHGGALARVLAKQNVIVEVEGNSTSLKTGSYYTLPVTAAVELARAGYVQITNDAGRVTQRETAVDPKAATRSRRKRRS